MRLRTGLFVISAAAALTTPQFSPAQNATELAWETKFEDRSNLTAPENYPLKTSHLLAGDEQWNPAFSGWPGVDGHVDGVAVLDGNVYFGGHFGSVDGGKVLARGIARWDGTSWHDVGGGLDGLNSRAAYDLAAGSGMLYVGGQFDRAGSISAANIAVWDGGTWEALGGGVRNENSNAWVAATAFRRDTVYAGGFFSHAGDVPAAHIARWTGSKWESMGDGLDHWVEDIAVTEERIVAVGYRTRQEVAKEKVVAEWKDGAWVSLADSVRWGDHPGRVDAVTIVGEDIIVGGLFKSIDGVAAESIARWDGEQWHPLGTGVDSNIWELAPYEDGLVAVGLFRHAGGEPAARIAIWDGANWSSAGEGIHDLGCNFEGRIDAVAVDGPIVYVGGCFSTAGGLRADNAAYWDGGSWHRFGDPGGWGLSESVRAVEIGHDGTYAAGLFSFAGDSKVNGIARWDGSMWHPLGSGLNGVVYAMAAKESDLYAAGYFPITADTVVEGLVARWDRRNWHRVIARDPDSSGFRASSIRDLAFFKGDLVVAGEFAQILNGEYLGRDKVMRWDGKGWHRLAEGIEGERVSDLVATDSVLYAAGFFASAGGLSANNIAAWDGVQWKPLGSGVEHLVYAVEWHDGQLYVGGSFRTAGGKPARHVARWDGSEWHPLAGGTDAGILDLASDGDALYAIGAFQEPGRGIARWDGEKWEAMGSGLNEAAFALAARDGQVYVGGRFTSAGGKPAVSFAHWSEERADVGAELPPAAVELATISAYPNPFTSVVNIRFTVDVPGRVRIALFDLLGREVAPLLDEWIAAGTYVHSFQPASRVASGPYFCRITTGRTVAGAAVVHVK